MRQQRCRHMVIRRRAWTKREGLWQHYVLIVFHIGGRDRIRDKRAMTKPYEIAHRRPPEGGRGQLQCFVTAVANRSLAEKYALHLGAVTRRHFLYRRVDPSMGMGATGWPRGRLDKLRGIDRRDC